MLATFGDQFRSGPSPQEVKHILEDAGVESKPSETEWHGVKMSDTTPEELEAVLSNTILKEFKVRLDRIGIEYQTPQLPAAA